jgi:hypothetical protein
VGSRGGFDIALDNIDTALEAYSAEEVGIDPTLGFTVEADAYRYQNIPPGAYVYSYLGPLNPTPSRSAAYKHHEYDVEYWLDLIVESQGSKAGAAYTRADAAAGLRLRYLIQQVLATLLRPENADLSLPPGTLDGRPMPRFEPLPPEMQIGERPIIGARGILSLHMAWDPTLLTGPALDSIDVDAGRFAALYDLGG